MARVEPTYQNAPVRTATRAPERKMNPIFLGVVIGVLLGIGIALAVALWLNRNVIPSLERQKSTAELPPTKLPRIDAPKVDVSPKSEPSSNTKSAAPADAGKPRFEFYQILPGEKGEKVEKGTKAPKPAKSEPPAAPKPSSPTTPKPPASSDTVEREPASTSYVLQAGAFQNQSDAENVKAKIAFAGFEASVRPVNLPDKGTLFRVRIGPYKSLDEVNRIKGVLAENGISANIMKAE